jgi:uncharacterized protein YndB with AHSA1/START domain
MAEPDPSAPVRIEVTLPAPFEVVWRWFRDPELIRRWHGWDYESDEGGLDDEIRFIYVDGTVADEARRTLHIGAHLFTFEAGAGGSGAGTGATVVRVTRAAPVSGDEWTDDYYDDVEEGWISFLQQLRFTLARHQGDERETLFLSGETVDPLAGLEVAEPEGAPYRSTVGPEQLTGTVWFRSAHQLGLVVDGWGPGLLIAARSATAPADHGSAMAILTTYGLAPAAQAALTERWTTWWSQNLQPPG